MVRKGQRRGDDLRKKTKKAREEGLCSSNQAVGGFREVPHLFGN